MNSITPTPLQQPFFIRFRWLCFGLSMLLLAASWSASRQLSFDRSLQRMFAPDDPVRTDFEFLQSKFGVADLVVFAYRDRSLWDSDGNGLARLKNIRERIEAVPGVAIAMDLSKIDQMLGQLSQPLRFLGAAKNETASHPMLDSKNELANAFKKIFEGQTHSRDGELVAIACLLKPTAKSLVSTKDTLQGLREVANSLSEEGLQRGLLVGQPVMVEEGFDEIEQDGERLGWVSSISLALLILIGFRSLRWAIVTIVVVQWSLIVTRGLLVWLAWDLTMVSSMLSSIVTVIGVATTVHWMLGYQQAMREHGVPIVALTASIRRLWKPIAWACITDAIGFASLLFARVGPVQDYGAMMALASLVVLIGILVLVPTLTLLPLASSRLAKPLGVSFELLQIPGDSVVRRCLVWLLNVASRWPSAIAGGSVALAVLAVAGSLRLQVETDFIKNFQADAPLVIAYRAVEEELGGAGVWDVVLPAPKVLTQSYLDQVLRIQQRLIAIELPETTASDAGPIRLTKVMSFADADMASRKSILGNLSIEARLLGMRQVMGDFVDTLITKTVDGKRFLRVMLRSREQAEATQKEKLILAVRQIVEEETAGQQWKAWVQLEESPASDQRSPAIVSGYYVLLSQLVSSVVADQWRCFAVATLGIWIAMSLALRSPAMALLALLPNALPSLCILGWLGWMEVRVNLGAAMIAAVSMGLSVDSSLHYLIRYRQERSQGNSLDGSLVAAQSEIGMAILLSTVALVLGFGSLATSHFLPTIVFGTTAAISMLGGLFGNLVILPALLRLTQSRPARSKEAPDVTGDSLSGMQFGSTVANSSPMG